MKQPVCFLGQKTIWFTGKHTIITTIHHSSVSSFLKVRWRVVLTDLHVMPKTHLWIISRVGAAFLHQVCFSCCQNSKIWTRSKMLHLDQQNCAWSVFRSCLNTGRHGNVGLWWLKAHYRCGGWRLCPNITWVWSIPLTKCYITKYYLTKMTNSLATSLMHKKPWSRFQSRKPLSESGQAWTNQEGNIIQLFSCLDEWECVRACGGGFSTFYPFSCKFALIVLVNVAVRPKNALTSHQENTCVYCCSTEVPALHIAKEAPQFRRH